jgi:hypothetical protein
MNCARARATAETPRSSCAGSGAATGELEVETTEVFLEGGRSPDPWFAAAVEFPDIEIVAVVVVVGEVVAADVPKAV